MRGTSAKVPMRGTDRASDPSQATFAEALNNVICPFCRIANHEIPASVRYESDLILAFDDIHPNAPTHILVIPKTHIASLDALASMGDAALAGELLRAVGRVATEVGIATTGYRVIVNCGADGGQEVDHLHVHLLGGKRLGPMVAAN